MEQVVRLVKESRSPHSHLFRCGVFTSNMTLLVFTRIQTRNAFETIAIGETRLATLRETADDKFSMRPVAEGKRHCKRSIVGLGKVVRRRGWDPMGYVPYWLKGYIPRIPIKHVLPSHWTESHHSNALPMELRSSQWPLFWLNSHSSRSRHMFNIVPHSIIPLLFLITNHHNISQYNHAI